MHVARASLAKLMAGLCTSLRVVLVRPATSGFKTLAPWPGSLSGRDGGRIMSPGHVAWPAPGSFAADLGAIFTQRRGAMSGARERKDEDVDVRSSSPSQVPRRSQGSERGYGGRPKIPSQGQDRGRGQGGGRGQGKRRERRGRRSALDMVDDMVRKIMAKEPIEDVLGSAGALDNRACTQVISRCGKRKAWRMAEEVVRVLKAAGVQPTVVTYNALISAYEKGGGQWELAEETVAEMREAGLKPTVVTYSALISTYEKGGGQWQRAEEAVAEMREAKVQPNAFTYNALISAYAKGGGEWERAEAAVAEMKAAGLQPNNITYGALISAYEKGGGQWERAEAAVKEMRAARLKRVDIYRAEDRVKAMKRDGQEAGVEEEVSGARQD